jgi:hypothetical protein
MTDMRFARLVVDGAGWRAVMPIVQVPVADPGADRRVEGMLWVMTNQRVLGVAPGDVVVQNVGEPEVGCWEVLPDGRLVSLDSAPVLAAVTNAEVLG